MPLAFDVGDTVTLTFTFTDADDQPANPSELTVRVQDPSGNVEEVAATEVETGIWEAKVAVDEAGTWRYRLLYTGVDPQAEASSFIVRRLRVAEEGS